MVDFNIKRILGIGATVLLASLSLQAFAHGVDDNTRQFLTANEGIAVAPYLYIGAKHMVTGYDHLLFLLGVIFFLYRPKDVLILPVWGGLWAYRNCRAVKQLSQHQRPGLAKSSALTLPCPRVMVWSTKSIC